MILADKIIELRKKNNWSQEELAEKLGVSRQAVSKWESAQSTPDLERILAMSELFGVSTDVLIKDEIEIDTKFDKIEESGSPLRKLSMEEANEYLSVKFKTARPFAFGVALCIMSSIPPILSELWKDEDLGGAVGAIIAVFIIAIAVTLFILNAFKLKPFEWMEKEAFETAYGVDSMVKERLQSFMPKFITYIVVGIALCVTAVATFVATDFLPELIGVKENVTIAIGMFIIAIAVYFFVNAGILRDGYSKLLQEDDYHPDKKAIEKKIEPFIGLYWLVIVAVYLGYSFYTMRWDQSWIIWPVAGVAFAAFYIVLEMIYGRNINK
ncbi:MAG: helix-turn-helix transcriptional regulator [Ruminococcaceae bacterium]|nr:helix-turn-helix transcriptional regulator [Oscillospiraceae bacterium]